jgi:hypothetical protein
MAHIEKLTEQTQINSIYTQLPLWFAVGEDRFYVWNDETSTLDLYKYNEMEIVFKHTGSEQPLDEIDITLSNGQKFSIKDDRNQKFVEFHLDLLGQLAIHI